MKKIKTVKHNKIWGYEIWLYSPVPDLETTFENGVKNTGGPLIKIIKADKPLSVQVHPDDKLAKKLENQPNGKSESWYVIKNNPKAKLVMGLKNYDPVTIRKKLENGTFKSELNLIEAKAGEFFNIPAGLIHGIGSGLTIFEVQQPSDTTYRYYDYDRLENGKPRELHVDKAIQSQKELDWKLSPISDSPLIYKNIVGTQTYMTDSCVLKTKSIIVNLETYESYVGDPGDKIQMNNYVIVSF